ncbi:MAG TPA: hypothetical protein VNJ02_01200 [Vicinamibacterales bacterium]|nr:hypothetical protein [Vicinamibacterales bacterium]
MTPLPDGLLVLLVLAMPIAAITWTVTHEEVFREPRDFCVKRTEGARSIFVRKLFYLPTCEYCFSHWVTVGMLALTGFRLLFDDWRAYLISGFSLVWVANHYMSLFGRLRLGIKSERIDVSLKEELCDKVTDA